MATVTRAVLAGAVHTEEGLPLREARALVDAVIEAIAERLEAGETVKISGFGSFSLRDKGP
ncbi:MAG: HU family DNA-binding protein, partial [Rhodospirillales bacterium]|nr:HU family DNA-binding protein [Rhodospirillales bacterium]